MTATDRWASAKAQTFQESVIREMSRLCAASGGVNLAQGFPDFACPQELKDAAKRAIDDDVNQYAITWGAKAFRTASRQGRGDVRRLDGRPGDRDLRHLRVDRGDDRDPARHRRPGRRGDRLRAVLRELRPDAVLSGATPRYVTLHAPDWSIDEAELRAAFSDRTRAIIVNTPHNPTGKVFSRAELELISELCSTYDALCLTDEIYEHIVYDAEHVPPATVPGLEDRTVTINALSKTYAVTGWRVGWAIAPAGITGSIRKVHDFLTVGAAAPLQAAGAAAMALPAEYYAKRAGSTGAAGPALLGAADVGFTFQVPDGAYYVLCQTGDLDPAQDSSAFARRIVVDPGVAAVPAPPSTPTRRTAPARSASRSPRSSRRCAPRRSGWTSCARRRSGGGRASPGAGPGPRSTTIAA
jgi:aminotransferase